MRNFTKIAKLHRVFFKRADRFNSYESGDKGQGKYKPSPPSGNTLGGPAPDGRPKEQKPTLEAPAPKPILKPEPVHVPTGVSGSSIKKTISDVGDFGKSLGRQVTGYNPYTSEFSPSGTAMNVPETSYLNVKRQLGLDPEFRGLREQPGIINAYRKSITGTGTDDIGPMLRQMNPFSPEYQSREKRDFIEATNKSRGDQARMGFNLAHPFGQPDVHGVISNGWVGNKLNPLLLAPSELPKNLMPFVEKEAPHLARPPFIMPASPTDGLQ